jgi:hypothetical protein
MGGVRVEFIALQAVRVFRRILKRVLDAIDLISDLQRQL